MNGDDKCFDETKYTSFLIENEKHLEAYHILWNKSCNIMRRGFDRRFSLGLPVSNINRFCFSDG